MLIDTSGFLSVIDPEEPFHDLAVKLYDDSSNRITTSYVLAEYTALAAIRGIPRLEIIEFSKRILTDSTIQIVWVSERMHRDGVKLMANRADKTYSLCDAVSFVVMRSHSLIQSLTTDRHFSQEGFVRLLH